MLTEIPGNFEEIANTTVGLIPGTSGWDDTGVDVTVPPFTYFGQTFTTLRIVSNGWISFVPTTLTTFTNKTVPTTSAPFGTIAPFWDDLADNLSVPTSNVYWTRRAGVTIVEWYRVEQLGDNDDMSFQVKLFDNGVIRRWSVT